MSVDEDQSVATLLTALYSGLQDDLQFELLDSGDHGMATLVGNQLDYTPSANFFGAERLLFKVSDIQGNVSIGEVFLTINPINDPPLALDAQLAAIAGQSLDVPEAEDLDPNDQLSWTLVSMPKHGTLSGEGAFVTYRPELDFEGDDQFQFKVNDGSVDSNVATVRISVLPESGGEQDGVPVISLLGEALILHEAGTAFRDPGAIAVDAEDGNLSVSATAELDVWQLGEQSITYTAIDSQGNEAVPQVRIVRVRDTTPPELSLLGEVLVSQR